MNERSDATNARRALLLRVGVLALLALAVAGAVYLRQGTLSRPRTALEAPMSGPAAGVAGPGASPSPPELPGVEPAAGTGVAEAGEEAAPEIAAVVLEEPTPEPERPAAAPELPKPLPKLIDLGADKCIPCKQMAPILEDLKVEHADRFEVVFIDVWKNPSEADRYGIRIIPTQIFYDANGKELFRHTGFYSKEQILAKWKQLGVDVGGL